MVPLYKRGSYPGLRNELLANLPPLTTPYNCIEIDALTNGIARLRCQISDSEFATPGKNPPLVWGTSDADASIDDFVPGVMNNGS